MPTMHTQPTYLPLLFPFSDTLAGTMSSSADNIMDGATQCTTSEGERMAVLSRGRQPNPHGGKKPGLPLVASGLLAGPVSTAPIQPARDFVARPESHLRMAA